jgi:hypothetical protein
MGEPIEPKYIATMRALGRAIDDELNGDVRPRKTGFVVLMFDFGDAGRLNYISNAERADMIAALHELIARLEGRAVDYKGSG